MEFFLSLWAIFPDFWDWGVVAGNNASKVKIKKIEVKVLKVGDKE